MNVLSIIQEDMKQRKKGRASSDIRFEWYYTNIILLLFIDNKDICSSAMCWNWRKLNVSTMYVLKLFSADKENPISIWVFLL